MELPVNMAGYGLMAVGAGAMVASIMPQSLAYTGAIPSSAMLVGGAAVTALGAGFAAIKLQ